MPLPDDFSPWEHLHTQMLTSYNQLVEKTFFGVPSDDISTTLGGMKIACLLLDDDSVEMTNLRLMLFFFVYQGMTPTPVFAVPSSHAQVGAKGHPELILVFLEDWSETLIVNGLRRSETQIKIRLMSETAATITPAKAHALALRIKELFATGKGFSFEKGVHRTNYTDPMHGYWMQILANSEVEGMRVIQKVLEIQNHSLNENMVSVSQSKRPPRAIPSGEHLVYGKERKLPRDRPTIRTTFIKAELHVEHLPNPVVLIDRRGRMNALIH